MVDDSILLNDWHPVMQSRDLKQGIARSTHLLGEDLVLWRHDDQIIASLDRCPHRGAKLSSGKIANNCLVCPYHGLEFDHKGECVKIPAHPNIAPPKRAYLHTYLVQEKYGLVWLSLGKPAHKIPVFLEWDEPNCRPVFCGPYHFKSSGFRVIENFLDVAHFPFIHSELLGDRIYPAINDYEVEVEIDRITINNVKVWQPNPDGTGQSGLVTYNYRILRPLTAYFSKETPSGCLSIFFTVTPVEEEECLAWMWMGTNPDNDIPEAEQKAFQDQIIAQDLPIVESQRPKCLPLDLESEYHLPCDKGAIAYRKWLKRLGITFGVI